MSAVETGVRVGGAVGPVSEAAGRVSEAQPEDDGSGHRLRRSLSGGALLLAGRLLSLSLNFVTQLVVVRSLTKDDYGAFAAGMSIVLIAEAVIHLGLDRAVPRFVAQYDEERRYAAVRGALLVQIVTLTTMSLAVVLLVPSVGAALGVLGGVAVAPVVAVLIVLAPLQAVDDAMAGLFAVLSDARSIFFRKYVLAPVLRLAAAVVVLSAGGSVLQLAVGYVAAAAAGTLVYGVLIVAVMRRSGLLGKIRRVRAEPVARTLFAFGLPLLTTDLVLLSVSSLDAVVVLHFHGTGEVARLKVVQPVAMLVLAASQAFTPLFSPHLARVLARGEHHLAAEHYWRTATWVALLSFPVLAVILAGSQPLVALLYGPRYAGSWIYLVILAVGLYAQASTGFNGLTLQVFGRVRAVMAAAVVTAALQAASLLTLVPPLGALGAAISGAGTLVLYNALKQWLLARSTPITWPPRRYLGVYVWIVGASLLLGLVSVVVRPGLLVAVALATCVTAVVYAGVARRVDVLGTFPSLRRRLGRVPVVRRLAGPPKPAPEPAATHVRASRPPAPEIAAREIAAREIAARHVAAPGDRSPAGRSLAGPGASRARHIDRFPRGREGSARFGKDLRRAGVAMTLSTVWAVLRRWLLPLIVISLAAGAIVAAWALNQPVQYSARTEMIVGEVNQSADSTRASTQLIGTYADLIVNEQALTAAVRALGGGWTTSQLGDAVDVRFSEATRLLTLTVTMPTEKQALQVAQLLPQGLIGKASAQAGAAGQAGKAGQADAAGQEGPGVVSIVVEPAATVAPVPSNAALQAGLAAVATFGLGIVLLLLLERVRSPIRTSADVTAVTGKEAFAVFPQRHGTARRRSVTPSAGIPEYRLLALMVDRLGEASQGAPDGADEAPTKGTHAEGSPRLRTLAVVGPDARSPLRVAANLADTLAADGRRVVLVTDREFFGSAADAAAAVAPAGGVMGVDDAAGPFPGVAGAGAGGGAYLFQVHAVGSDVRLSPVEASTPFAALRPRTAGSVSVRGLRAQLAAAADQADVVIFTAVGSPPQDYVLAWAGAVDAVLVVVECAQTRSSTLRDYLGPLERIADGPIEVALAGRRTVDGADLAEIGRRLPRPDWPAPPDRSMPSESFAPPESAERDLIEHSDPEGGSGGSPGGFTAGQHRDRAGALPGARHSATPPGPGSLP